MPVYRGPPVILVHLYGEDAELKDSGTWRFDPLGNWTRRATSGREESVGD